MSIESIHVVSEEEQVRSENGICQSSKISLKKRILSREDSESWEEKKRELVSYLMSNMYLVFVADKVLRGKKVCKESKEATKQG